jgi:PASTA domain
MPTDSLHPDGKGLIFDERTMPSPYTIVPSSESMVVKENSAETTFTVTNTTNRPLLTEFTLDADSPAKPEWLSIDRPQRVIPPRGVEQVVVKLQAPADAEGRHSFRIIAATDPKTENFTPGASVGFVLAKKAIVKPPPKIKWWMIVIAVVVLLGIIGGILAAVMGGGVPNVKGKDVKEAEQLLQNKGLTSVRKYQRSDEKAGVVIDQSPEPREKLPENKQVTLTVSGTGFVKVPVLTGLSLDDASKALANAGLQLGDKAVGGSGRSGTVVAQRPPAGIQVVSGTKVQITVAQ